MGTSSTRESGVGVTEVELDVTNVAHGGVFVARHDGRVVFVGDTLPGERVRARITDDGHKSFWRAETVEVLEAAPERRPHVWSEASVDRAPSERAGGAEFGHIRLEHQRELKRQVLADALQRMAGVETDVTVEAVAPPAGATGVAEADGTCWRTRVRLQVADDGSIGPYASRTHRVVDVGSLPLATVRIGEVAPLTRRFPGAAHVDVIAPSADSARVLVVERDGKGRPKPARHGVIHETVAGRTFRLETGGFWQVHARAAETLYHAVQDMIDEGDFDPRASNLDLYGGVGLLAVAVGDRFGETVRITTVESDARATEHATENLAEWIGANALTDRVDRYLQHVTREAGAAERRSFEAATVVLDPPRAGAGRAVVDRLAAVGPRQLVYVACDPVALARDVGLLREHGYELRELRAFDLFPNTHHLEAVARLTR
ncbi:class I SAM-dependent RNA methyltransferase [Luethyella okanaganae]|uniref:Class I SAM-dependent RNA methyltransferase n=1 Tax=Luethyella okanaganae TaxID=69372 RepID=A0ABW1VAK3_9MICO